MTDQDLLARRFEEHRGRLRAVAYRMLGSLAETDDAVQETWLRVSKAGTEGVENLAGWLTTITARVSLNILRTRAARQELPLAYHLPDPVVGRVDAGDPEQEALLADSIGLAMIVVLDSLTPSERVAFVLHDVFGVPFDQIADIAECTPAAARQLASRARRKVADAPTPDSDLSRQRDVVDAFFAASRNGDIAGLLAVLAPDVVLRSDGGSGRSLASMVLRGATTVAENAVMFGRLSPFARPALVNGAAGAVVVPRDAAISIMGFIVRDGRIAAIDVLAAPERLSALDLAPWTE